MASQIEKIYQLGKFVLNANRRELSRGAEKIHLSNKPYQVLLYLVERRERMVTRGELLELFWQGRDVYDETLTKCVGAIRKALDDRTDSARFIETAYGEGYRYIGAFEERLFEETSSAEVESAMTLESAMAFEKETNEAVLENATDAEAETNSETASEISSATLWTNQTGRAPTRLPPFVKRRAPTPLLVFSLILFITAVAALTVNRRQPASNKNSTNVESANAHSIAVLPVKNLTGDASNEYLSDGITDNLITSLAKVQGLKVIARSSAFEFKARQASAQEIGGRLGVATFLEGSLLKSGGHLRVAVRLVNAKDGQTLWTSEADENAIENSSASQDEIARRIVSALQIKLNDENQKQFAKRRAENAEAYQAYLKGRFFLNKRTPEGITKATEYFKQAIAIDPNYALAYASLAESYDKSFWFIEQRPKELMSKEREAAQNALALDDSSSEAHLAMATVYANEWNLNASAREEERAIELNPGSAEAHHNYAYRLIDLCRPDEAVAEIKQARELDPLNVVMNVDVGEILLFARRNDEAISALRDALEMDANRANAHFDLAQAYERKGMYAEAVAEYLKDAALSGEGTETASELQAAFAAGGIKNFWRKRLEQMSKRSYIDPTVIGNIYTALGEKDEAFAWYEKAYQAHSPALVGAKSSPVVDPLRSDPRYGALLRRIGFSE